MSAAADLESGASSSATLAAVQSQGGEEQCTDDKKTTLAHHPLVLQAWSLLRAHAPALLPYLGDKPPRLERRALAQAALAYQALVHVVLLLWLLFPKHCPTAAAAAAGVAGVAAGASAGAA